MPIRVGIIFEPLPKQSLSYQKEIILDQINLEFIHGQSSVCHLFHEIMLGVLSPRLHDIFSLQHILDEMSTAMNQHVIRPIGGGRPYGVKGNE
jgi:hypothetical protein